MSFDIESYLARQIRSSRQIAGAGLRTQYIVDRARYKLCDIQVDPESIERWVALLRLVIEGAMRASTQGNLSDDQIETITRRVLTLLQDQQARDEFRAFPEWPTLPGTTEHESFPPVRTGIKHHRG